MSRMRPHTRTQCQEGNQGNCPECKETPLLQNNSSNNSSTNLQNNITPISGTNNAGAAGGSGGSSAACHSGTTRATASIASSSSGSSGYSTSSSTSSGSTGTSNSDPFVAPTGTVSRRSSTCGFLTSHHGKSRLSLQGGLTLGAAAASNGDATRAMLIVELPAEILFKILSYMSFKEISYLRMVSRRFNEICASMLNSTFQRLQSQMLSRFQEIKTQMPRRESARRNHPLAQECDVVETLHMRLSLLQMTLGKHIERKHVCFFAGEILDEVLRIIRYIQKAPTGQPRNPKNPYIYMEDELFDLSTMAMEYFKEHIEPTLPEITYFGADYLDFTSFSGTSPPKRRSASGCGSASLNLLGNCLDSPCSSRASVAGSSVSEAWSSASTVATEADSAIYMEAGPSKQPPQSNMVLRKRIRRIRQGMKRYNDQLVEYKKELKTCKTKMETQSKQVHEYSERFEQYDKKFAESSNKFQTLLTELNKCKIELQYWRSKSTTLLALPSTINPTCASCSAPLLPEGGLQSAENAEAELKNLANKGIFLTEDLTPTSDSDPPPPTEAESPPPLNSSDKDISGSLDVQKQPQQLQQPYLIEDFIPTVFVEQESKSPSLVTKPQTCKSGPPSPVSAVGRKRRSRDDLTAAAGDLLAGDLNDLESKRKSSLRGGSTGVGSGGGSTVGSNGGSTSGSSGGSAVKNTRFKRPKMSSTAS